jgi:hypothetical protein
VAVSNALDASLDPLHLKLSITKEVDVAFSENCMVSATMIYTIDEMTGLGDFVIDNMAVVTGSGSIQVSLLRGTNWEANFDVHGSLPSGLEVLVNLEIIADACGIPFSLSVSGVLNAANACVDFIRVDSALCFPR